MQLIRRKAAEIKKVLNEAKSHYESKMVEKIRGLAVFAVFDDATAEAYIILIKDLILYVEYLYMAHKYTNEYTYMHMTSF